MRWFWREKADELNRRAQIKEMMDTLPSRSLVANDSIWPSADELSSAADAAIEVGQCERRSLHEMLTGNPNSDMMWKIRWLNMLRGANAGGVERMVVLDAAAPGGVHADVDVELSLFAAELDVLEALAPGLRRPELADQVKVHLHVEALQAMADKDEL